MNGFPALAVVWRFPAEIRIRIPVMKIPFSIVVLTAAALTLEAAPKKVVVVSATKGFRHSSIPIAENVLTTLGETSGAYQVVDVVRGGPDGKDDAEVASKLTLEKLRDVDAVIFANTTGDLPLPDKVKKRLEKGENNISPSFHLSPSFPLSY
jgi:hypothetical protein